MQEDNTAAEEWCPQRHSMPQLRRPADSELTCSGVPKAPSRSSSSSSIGKPAAAAQATPQAAVCRAQSIGLLNLGPKAEELLRRLPRRTSFGSDRLPATGLQQEGGASASGSATEQAFSPHVSATGAGVCACAVEGRGWQQQQGRLVACFLNIKAARELVAAARSQSHGSCARQGAGSVDGSCFSAPAFTMPQRRSQAWQPGPMQGRASGAAGRLTLPAALTVPAASRLGSRVTRAEAGSLASCSNPRWGLTPPLRLLAPQCLLGLSAAAPVALRCCCQSCLLGAPPMAAATGLLACHWRRALLLCAAPHPFKHTAHQPQAQLCAQGHQFILYQPWAQRRYSVTSRGSGDEWQLHVPAWSSVPRCSGRVHAACRRRRGHD